MNTRFLGTWVSIFGSLFLFAGAALQLWHLADRDPTLQVLSYAAILIISGSMLVTLGTACHRIARLEDRVQELERQRKSAVILDGGMK